MKKKSLYVIVFILVCLILTSAMVISNTNVIKCKLTSSAQEIKAGEKVTVTLKFDEYNQITKGINAFKATLKYDNDNIFETLTQEDFKTLNNWEELKYNPTTKELVAIKKPGSKQAEDVLQITLTAKINPKLEKTSIEIKDISTSEGKGDIILDNKTIDVNIVEEQPTEKEELTSTKYDVSVKYVSRIIPETTVQEFMKNIEIKNKTEQTKVELTDAKGNVLQEESKVTTGTKLQVGEKIYELIVIGDIDGDSLISVNDLADLKLHIIEAEILKGIEYEAADMNKSGTIEVDDLAQMKLVYIGEKILE